MEDYGNPDKKEDFEYLIEYFILLKKKKKKKKKKFMKTKIIFLLVTLLFTMFENMLINLIPPF